MEEVDTWIVSLDFSIILNGSPKGFFPTIRRLKQGDPLSPFLFSMVADALSEILREGENKNLIKEFCLGKEMMPISHLNVPLIHCSF